MQWEWLPIGGLGERVYSRADWPENLVPLTPEDTEWPGQEGRDPRCAFVLRDSLAQSGAERGVRRCFQTPHAIGRPGGKQRVSAVRSRPAVSRRPHEEMGGSQW